MVGRFAGGAGVDEIARLDAESGATVNAAFPADAAFGETVGVFFEEEGFGTAIAHLLFEVFPGGGAAMVPDEGGSGEAEREAGVVESPAEVDVVACGLEDGIEAADLREGGLFDRKVAAGEVLGGGVIEHDVGGRAGGGGGEGEAEGVWRGREIGSADGSVPGFGISVGEPSEPLFVGAAIIVGESEDFAGGVLGSVIAGGGEAGGWEVEDVEIFLPVEESGGAISGAIIDDDDFEVGVVDVSAGFEAGGEPVGAVAGADDDGESGWVFGERIGEDGVANGGEGGLFRAIAAKEAEGPVVHHASVVKPVIGPGVEGGSGEAGLAGEAEGLREEGGLQVLGIAGGIETELGEENGPVAGEVVEAGEVVGEGFAFLEVDIEGGEVGRGWLEVFGGGKVGVADREAGGGFLAGADERIEGTVDFPGSHPAGHVGGDFIADEDGSEAGVVFVE